MRIRQHQIAKPTRDVTTPIQMGNSVGAAIWVAEVLLSSWQIYGGAD